MILGGACERNLAHQLTPEPQPVVGVSQLSKPFKHSTPGATDHGIHFANALEQFFTASYSDGTVKWQEFEAFSARESARCMGMALDEAVLRYNDRRVR